MNTNNFKVLLCCYTVGITGCNKMENPSYMDGSGDGIRISSEISNKADKVRNRIIDDQERRIANYKVITENAKEHANKMNKRARDYQNTELGEGYRCIAEAAERAARAAEKNEKSYEEFVKRRKNQMNKT
ncbi:MAG: hypothetical protein NMK33_06390 (plasmid) [Candidatus Cardinium sp.]|uniref:hypothetical protein n=1 Tax=Cardinium endosymbiont of Dermatophagoides farinae TaxID=2597823 RepID=UPI0011825BAF|nr:hypothetical protein [Cardinium endosymbiont of Dermatophagoides farinae]TSJ80175.1 hypothetical protein FPG78_06145 [Cardinium endosymbiont of Dermatophagoides farinae]UWW97548.1 MAG: hypothetical protein NMK33_06390 [Candidatus Cardinium sp.]